MRTLRVILAFPLWVAGVAAGLFSDIALHRLSVVLHRAAVLWKDHVYIVLVWARRWVTGEPTWQLNDLTMLRIQPRTKAQIAYADTLSEIQRVRCDCTDPECVVAKGQIVFVPRCMTSGVVPMGIADMPPAIQARARAMERVLRMPPDELERMLDEHDASTSPH